MSGIYGQLPTDGPVILAWGHDSLLDVDDPGPEAARSGNVLYYIPADVAVRARSTFRRT